jgi:uncharacterized protein YbaA (DUF1428 family)
MFVLLPGVAAEGRDPTADSKEMYRQARNDKSCVFTSKRMRSKKNANVISDTFLSDPGGC